MDEAIVKAVLDDWQTAPIREQLKAILGFLVKLNNTPDDVTDADIVVLEQQGLSKEAIAEAAYVCFVFNLIDRLADAFNFPLPTEDELKVIGADLYKSRYTRASLRG